MGDTKHLVVFEDRKIRRKRHNDAWWFSIIDVVGILTESPAARRYWSDLKRKIEQEQGVSELYDKIVQLKLPSADGKAYSTDCANTETMLRIIQSIPSPKAEPFKLWLARVGYERVQEMGNPELATRRTRALYKAKGYPDAWIEKRMRGIAVREELTGEWSNRGVKGDEYAILTAEISQAAFGLNPGQHKQLKGLKRENLPDHMTDLELIFSMLGEASTAEIVRTKDAQGFSANQKAARIGGKIAGEARDKLEQQTGRRIVSRENYLPVTKRLKSKE
jgi:prophage antirepressor-like protein